MFNIRFTALKEAVDILVYQEYTELGNLPDFEGMVKTFTQKYIQDREQETDCTAIVEEWQEQNSKPMRSLWRKLKMLSQFKGNAIGLKRSWTGRSKSADFERSLRLSRIAQVSLGLSVVTSTVEVLCRSLSSFECSRKFGRRPQPGILRI